MTTYASPLAKAADRLRHDVSLDDAMQGLVNENTALTNENIDLKRQVDPSRSFCP